MQSEIRCSARAGVARTRRARCPKRAPMASAERRQGSSCEQRAKKQEGRATKRGRCGRAAAPPGRTGRALLVLLPNDELLATFTRCIAEGEEQGIRCRKVGRREDEVDGAGTGVCTKRCGEVAQHAPFEARVLRMRATMRPYRPMTSAKICSGEDGEGVSARSSRERRDERGERDGRA